jgi:hypothetical protein
MVRELVIAHYHGDIRWIPRVAHLFDRVTVYVKSEASPAVARILGSLLPVLDIIPLPNVGREAHTFLQHCHSRYDSLSDLTVFSQDGYADKLTHDKFLRVCAGEALVNHCTVDTPWDKGIVHVYPMYQNMPLEPSGLTQREFRRDYIDPDIDPKDELCPWLNGAYVCATAEEIRRAPRERYRRLLEDTGLGKHRNPEESYLLERMWYTLWQKRENTVVG